MLARVADTRAGFALVATLVATILIAALLASLFFAVTEETRTQSTIGRQDHAFAVAESALEAGLDGLRTWPIEELAVGAAQTHLVASEGFPAAVHVTRLDSTLYWLVAVVGDAGDPSAGSRRIGILAHAATSSSDSIRIVRVTERGWSELY
jgi:type II secretory pathway pseudopilin PulG